MYIFLNKVSILFLYCKKHSQEGKVCMYLKMSIQSQVSIVNNLLSQCSRSKVVNIFSILDNYFSIIGLSKILSYTECNKQETNISCIQEGNLHISQNYSLDSNQLNTESMYSTINNINNCLYKKYKTLYYYPKNTHSNNLNKFSFNRKLSI